VLSLRVRQPWSKSRPSAQLWTLSPALAKPLSTYYPPMHRLSSASLHHTCTHQPSTLNEGESRETAALACTKPKLEPSSNNLSSPSTAAKMQPPCPVAGSGYREQEASAVHGAKEYVSSFAKIYIYIYIYVSCNRIVTSHVVKSIQISKNH
jgi:hypothetical protein